jgi:[protein-PII] uridylyltransferase
LILEQSGAAINELFREVHICTALRNNLLHHQVKEHKNIHRQSRQALHFPIPTSVEFLTDPLNKQTIIELITTDHAGLLSKIGRIFIKQGISLHSAKISTIGSRAEDMFYITDSNLQPITDPVKQQKICEEILKALAEKKAVNQKTVR